MRPISRRRSLVTLSVFGALSLWINHSWISQFTNPRLRLHAEHSFNVETPAMAPVGLVLGCVPTVDDERSFYWPRLRTAAKLYHQGAVSALLVSGDNGHHGYDEPTAMKDDLVALGVPAKYVTCDYAGFRTLDSVVRAYRVFGQRHVLIVSQRFHVQRALFLAYHHGVPANGVAAAEPTIGMRTAIFREVLARAKACIDVMLGVEPKYYGPQENVRKRDAMPRPRTEYTQ